MTGNIILNVFIGLAFLYLLYSLFATIILELINNFLKLRATNLIFTLKRMLYDERKSGRVYGFWNAFLGFFGKISNSKNMELYRSFIKQPAIKYLGNGGFFNIPSYLTATDFSKALIDSVKDKGFVESTALAKVHTGLNEFFPEDSETKKHILSLLSDANNDLEKFKILVENWYDSTMERAIGWYKRKTQLILLLIGMVMAFGLNLDTLEIAKTLSKDKTARKHLVDMSMAYMSNNEKFIVKYSQVDTNGIISDSVAQAKIDTLLQVKKELEKDMADANALINAGWPEGKRFKIDTTTDTSKAGRISFYKNRAAIERADSCLHDTLLGVIFPANVNKKEFQKFVNKKYNGKKSIYKLSSYKRWMWYHHFLGYLLTALAISLGAPFWFDLLNKLVKLRGSMAQSTSGSSAESNKNQDVLKRVG